jgi:hypothetical protein
MASTKPARPSSAAPWYFETELIAESGRPEDEKIVVSGLATGPGQPIFALGLVYGIFSWS